MVAYYYCQREKHLRRHDILCSYSSTLALLLKNGLQMKGSTAAMLLQMLCCTPSLFTFNIIY